jgi:hypothetical protein
MGPLSYIQYVVDRNVVMRRILYYYPCLKVNPIFDQSVCNLYEIKF